MWVKMRILSNFPTQCFLTFCQLRSFCGLRVEKRRKSLLGLTCKTCKRVLFSPSATTANAKMKGQVTFFCSSLKDKREDGAADMLLLFAHGLCRFFLSDDASRRPPPLVDLNTPNWPEFSV